VLSLILVRIASADVTLRSQQIKKAAFAMQNKQRSTVMLSASYTTNHH